MFIFPATAWLFFCYFYSQEADMIQVPSNWCPHGNSRILFFAGGLVSLSSVNDKLLTGANQIQLFPCSSIVQSFCYLPNFLLKQTVEVLQVLGSDVQYICCTIFLHRNRCLILVVRAYVLVNPIFLYIVDVNLLWAAMHVFLPSLLHKIVNTFYICIIYLEQG